MDFLVFIIESPGPEDKLVGRSEAALLCQAAKLSGVQAISIEVLNRDELRNAIQHALPTAALATGVPTIPIAHISAHGCDAGIQLHNGTLVEWTELREMLLPLSASMRGLLILCMSSCVGASAMRMAMVPPGKPHAFWAIVGNGDSPFWSETAIGFATFYHHLSRGRTVQQAVEAMRHASLNEKFLWVDSETAQQSFLDHLARVLPTRLGDLAQLGVSVPPQQPRPAGLLGDLSQMIWPDGIAPGEVGVPGIFPATPKKD